jgi:hypothetical protein
VERELITSAAPEEKGGDGGYFRSKLAAILFSLSFSS